MTDLTDEQTEILTEGVIDFNDTLQTQSINLSAQAFNNALRLGCGLLLLPLVVVLAITFIRRGVDFSAIFVYSAAALLLSIGFAIIVANRAKFLVVKDKYEQDVSPDIARFLAEHGFGRSQFDRVADSVLPAEAPLRQYLVAVPPEPESRTPDPDGKMEN